MEQIESQKKKKKEKRPMFPNFLHMAFPGKTHLILSFWLVRDVVALESRTTFCPSTSYDLLTEKLP